MPELNEYKNKHLNEDIYILGSGKSVDFIDNSFFENKTIIGVNQVYKKTKCKYLLRKENKLLEQVINDNPDTIHFISKGDCGRHDGVNDRTVKNKFKNNNNIVTYNHNNNKCYLDMDIVTTIKDDELIVSSSTITTAIHLAAYMGSKNIFLVGHDGGLINGECNFNGYHNDETYKIAWRNGKSDYLKWLSYIEKDTIILKRMLMEKYKCNIVSINPFVNFNLEGNKYTLNYMPL